MKARWIGLALVLAVVTGVIGYWLGTDRASTPLSFAADPVPASSPSYPAMPAVVIADPDFATLRPDVPLREATVGTPPFDLTLPVPGHWSRTNPTSGEWRWYPPPEFVANTYFLRVRLIGNSYQTVATALDQRINALKGAGDVSDFHVESRTADGFVASYVTDQHRRVAVEQFIASPDSDQAYAWIALIGRERDRAGLEDLFPRVAAGATP